MNISMSWLIFILLLMSCNAGFCYLGYYIGSRFKIVEIKENEKTNIINNNPHEEEYRSKLNKDILKYLNQKDEEATVPGEEDA